MSTFAYLLPVPIRLAWVESLYTHLGVTKWPFSVVPRPEDCTFIAGRPRFRQDIESLIDGLARRDVSSINVLWSWYGAGKTHSLFFLRNRAQLHSNKPMRLIPIYTEFPKGARGFIDLYRAFMVSFDPSLLLDAVYEFTTGGDGDGFYDKLRRHEPDLAASLRLLAMGDNMEQIVAHRWLRGDALATSDLRSVGISQKISTTEQATRVMALIIRMLSDAAVAQKFHGGRLIWLIDEFQRAHSAGPVTLRDTNSGLHSLFNACPTGFSPIVSFSASPTSKTLPDWFSPELRDRIGTTRVMILPPLQASEALQFAKDVLDHYRLQDGQRRPDFAPFTEDACKAIIKRVADTGELRPRSIVHAFHAVLEAADPLIMDKKLRLIEPSFVSRVLAEYINVSTSPEEE